MSTPTIEQIEQHGSVRNYRSESVSRQVIKQIVHAGQRASTSSNLQTYSVVVTEDQQVRERLQDLCGNQQHIGQAPVFLTWCADFSRLGRVCRQQGYPLEAGYLENFLVSAVDCALAMQNAGLAAESLGLGFCYIGAIRNQPSEIISLLELPQYVFPVSGMTLGWPVQSPRIRPRLPLEAVLHWERYDEDDLDELQAYDQEMISTGIYSGRQVSGPSAPEDRYGWMEHSARRVAKPSRPNLREAVERAGFSLK
jgi:FMN reductase (NADPH)